MNILWDHGPATVQDVVRRLPAERQLAYTTVQTVLNVLHRKGKVKRTTRNRAYDYEAAVTRRGAATTAIRDLVQRLFGGSPEKLVLTMVETKQLTPQKLAELQRLVEEAKSQAKGDSS